MKKYSIIFILLLSFIAIINAKNPLKNKYEIVIIYNESEEVIIPLPILENLPVNLTNDPKNPEIINDGIFCNDDGKYIEAICRFKDKDNGSWEIKFTIEPLVKKGYSVFSIIIIKKKTVLQQNDFVFKGSAINFLNMGVSPFNIIGLHTYKNKWFSITLRIK